MGTTGIRRQTVGERCAQQVTAEGRPMELEEVVDWAVREGVTTARHPEIAVRNGLLRSPRVARLPGGAFVALLVLYDGHWLTLRARHPTADRRWICPGPFVHPLGTLIERGGLPWAGGGAVVLDDAAGIRSWAGPAGWLPDVPVEGLVGMQLRDGMLHTESVEPAEDRTDEHTLRVRAAVSRHLPAAWKARNGRWLGRLYVGPLDESPLVQLDRAVECAAIEEPTLFQEPGLPLGEVLKVPDAIETAWVDIPDPWTRRAHELRRELEWMQARDRDAIGRPLGVVGGPAGQGVPWGSHRPG